MKIGKATVPRSAICTSNENTIVVRGRDLSKKLIGQINFGDYFFLLVTGQPPRAGQRRAQCHAGGDRRTRPGAQRAGRAHDAGGRARRDAGRGGRGHPGLRLGDPGRVGDGRAPVLARWKRARRRARHRRGRAGGGDRLARRKQPIAGYGHPEHKERDARDALFDVSRAAGGDQRYVEIAEAAERALPEVVGKQLQLNVSGAIPAVLLGVGFPVNALKGVPMLARTASLIAHLNEELHHPIGFALSYQATRELEYTGDMPDGGAQV